MVWIEDSFAFIQRRTVVCPRCGREAPIEDYLAYKVAIVLGFAFVTRCWLFRVCDSCEAKEELGPELLPPDYRKHIPFFVRHGWLAPIVAVAFSVVTAIASVLMEAL